MLDRYTLKHQDFFVDFRLGCPVSQKGGTWGKTNDWFWPSPSSHSLCFVPELWWQNLSSSCGHSGSISILVVILRSFRYLQFPTWELACQQILFIETRGRESSSCPLCTLNPHSPVQISPTYPFSWQASHTCLSPSLPQLYFYFFLYFATSVPSTPPLIPLLLTRPFFWHFWQLPTELSVKLRGCPRICGLWHSGTYKLSKPKSIWTYSHTYPLSPSLFLSSVAVSLQAPRWNSHGNWSSVQSGRKFTAMFLRKLINVNLQSCKPSTCLSTSMPGSFCKIISAHISFHLFILIFSTYIFWSFFLPVIILFLKLYKLQSPTTEVVHVKFHRSITMRAEKETIEHYLYIVYNTCK